MVLRKITFDNSVRFQKMNKQEKVNQKHQKLVHSPVNKTKNYHKTIKNGLLVDLVSLSE